MKIGLCTLVAFVGLALSTTAPAESGERAAGKGPVVHTPAAPVLGVPEDNSRKFRAIPYALPPVGALRWRAPHSGDGRAGSYAPVLPAIATGSALE